MHLVTDDDGSHPVQGDLLSVASSSSSLFRPSPPAFRFTNSRHLDSRDAKTLASPVWAVNYDSSQLVHSPSFLAFQTYYDVNGNRLQVLPPAKPAPIAAESGSDSRVMSANGAPASADGPRRRLPCYNQVADAYVFQQTIDERLRRVAVTQAREDNLRLAGVQWIDSVRRALRLPVRTFDTAVVYYHKFRLVHSDGEYAFADAAAASLFAACKIEDTLKKSRDILCASHNLKVPRQDQLSPDDPIFESHSRTIIGLERLMLEAAGFDFRNRHPQHLLIKFLKHYGHTKDSPISKLAFKISLDIYRTFAPLKQCSASMAMACLELAVRLSEELDKTQESSSNNGQIHDRQPNTNTTTTTTTTRDLERMERDYHKWGINRAQIMETLLDLLDLYIHYRPSTSINTTPLDAFLQIRIPLNEEMDRKKLPRYTEYVDIHPPLSVDQGRYSSNNHNSLNGQQHRHNNGTLHSGRSSKNTSPKESWSWGGGRDLTKTSPSTNSSSAGPGSGSTAATTTTAAASAAGVAGPREGNQPGIRQRIGERGRDGTVRFMLNPDREREERGMVGEYGREDTGG